MNSKLSKIENLTARAKKSGSKWALSHTYEDQNAMDFLFARDRVNLGQLLLMDRDDKRESQIFDSLTD